MICPHCNANLLYKERGGKRCSRCRKKFALEPKQNPKHNLLRLGTKPNGKALKSLQNLAAAGGPLPGLLICRQAQPPGMDAAEPDLLDYGLSRLLVCQPPQVAGMLRANFFHVELGCPVLTLAEASPLPDALLAMLRRVDGPRVFFLHAASPEGVSLAPTLRRTLGLERKIKLTATGLRPIHALRLSQQRLKSLLPTYFQRRWTQPTARHRE